MLVDKITEEMKNLIVTLLNTKLVSWLNIPITGGKFHEEIMVKTDTGLTMKELKQLDEIAQKFGYHLDTIYKDNYVMCTFDNLTILFTKIEGDDENGDDIPR